MQAPPYPFQAPLPDPFVPVRRRSKGALIVTLVFAGLISLFFLFLYGTGPTTIDTWMILWQTVSCAFLILTPLLFCRMTRRVCSLADPARRLKKARTLKTLTLIYFITLCVYSAFLLLATMLLVLVALLAAFLCFDTGRMCLAVARAQAEAAR